VLALSTCNCRVRAEPGRKGACGPNDSGPHEGEKLFTRQNFQIPICCGILAKRLFITFIFKKLAFMDIGFPEDIRTPRSFRAGGLRCVAIGRKLLLAALAADLRFNTKVYLLQQGW
jgi:hypothetical protein